MNKHLILASGSPRRHELLKLITPQFDIATDIDVNESYPDTLPVEQVPEYLSRLKADAYMSRLTSANDVIVTADTVVILDDRILGKPHSRDEAIAMLKSLVGREHHVVTGVTLATTTTIKTFACKSAVHLSYLTDEQIEQYVDTFAPYDKAGSYGIQEWPGDYTIKGEENLYNVMGLPVAALASELERL